MSQAKFEEYLTPKIAMLNDKNRRMAFLLAQRMFVPQNYQKIRQDMDEKGLQPNVVDIGCGLGYGASYFEDGQYIGIDQSYPHIGIDKGQIIKLGKKFYGSDLPNINYIISSFPSAKIKELLKNKVAICSMSLSCYGEIYSQDRAKIFENYCKCLSSASDIYACGASVFGDFLADYFGNRQTIGEHKEAYETLPLDHIKVLPANINKNIDLTRYALR